MKRVECINDSWDIELQVGVIYAVQGEVKLCGTEMYLLQGVIDAKPKNRFKEVQIVVHEGFKTKESIPDLSTISTDNLLKEIFRRMK